MSPVAGSLRSLAAQIAERAQALGRRVEVDLTAVTSRAGLLPLGRPGLWSANRACRLVQTADGWIAVNLAREEDLTLIPAWLQHDVGDQPWAAVLATARTRSRRDLVEGARLLGLPVGGVGEVTASDLEPPQVRMGTPSSRRPRRLSVVDLSSLWAGPLCGAVLAGLGAEVVKIESASRPDPSRATTPEFFRRLNGGKAELALDFADPGGRTQLRERILGADVVITSARPRAFAQLGLAPAEVFSAKPDLVWVAISGYGWTGAESDRVAFGDDAAAAGGLVSWTARGSPRFLGDALADPLTGLSAAVGALKALLEGGGVIVDAALARTAAAAAAHRAALRAA